jgi:hypothetical protein
MIARTRGLDGSGAGADHVATASEPQPRYDARQIFMTLTRPTRKTFSFEGVKWEVALVVLVALRGGAAVSTPRRSERMSRQASETTTAGRDASLVTRVPGSPEMEGLKTLASVAALRQGRRPQRNVPPSSSGARTTRARARSRAHGGSG